MDNTNFATSQNFCKYKQKQENLFYLNCIMTSKKR